MTDQKQWYVGVDWASESHHVVLTDGDGRKIGERVETAVQKSTRVAA